MNAPAGMTHSQLATKLIVEGCLAYVAGNVQGKMSGAPTQLTELERADIGLKPGGQTYFYTVLPTGVFFDMQGSEATVWFQHADGDRALASLDAALKRAYPRARQLEDGAHPQYADARLRSYEVDFGNARVALLNVEYPRPGAPPRRFLARITALARKN
ncbi:MAG: hypothetical protein IT518_02600 [Burkholderiales bacterium]|nr:hypothetical protein [Burkholderiales bacterium]